MGDFVAPDLPVEILILIAQFLYWADEGQKDSLLSRQKNMYNFCLLGRAWYSASIEFLYRSPQLARGNKFGNFLSTVSPQSRAKKSKVDLGSLVKELHLQELVHHSSPSQTARLLKAASSSLISFTAPRVSFAINSLAALSRCQNLLRLDLSLVIGSSISFPKLKKAISGIKRLECLILPTSMKLVHTNDTVDQWPQSLIDLIVGGHVDYETMLDFCWPENLEKLTFDHCVNLDLYVLAVTLRNKRLSQGLRELTIGSDNHDIWKDEVENEQFDIAGALESMEMLYHLKIPADLATTLLDGPGLQVSPIQILEIDPAQPGFELESDDGEWLQILLLRGLQNQFSNVWCLKVSPDVGLMLNDYRKIDDEIWLHLPDDDDPRLAEFESTHPFGLTILN
ncbi:hypothetical protein N7509_008725 [Penicillium cosmopolitanum]|uniref:F-box domain-containing protein n=1 Tax=Penicillium cosmopolitanum TaxID=1131564 RepID=A0A9W9VN69_9EURO|nr:uncharacterized protein N7509_008725 [Penicillium cosmopolitanum]KAJ5386184.1 hypothetical protein N7509_008725 [Penicillium cosmopolitanum]